MIVIDITFRETLLIYGGEAETQKLAWGSCDRRTEWNLYGIGRPNVKTQLSVNEQTGTTEVVN